MDFDTVEIINLDRMIGATVADVRLARGKAEVASRLMRLAATARNPDVRAYDLSVCEPDGLAAALDYDILISCVDRPWARGVLNSLAYADLLPVLDGGIGIDTFDDGALRNAVWRTHLITPGQPCLVRNRQLDPAHIQTDKHPHPRTPRHPAQSGLLFRGPGRSRRRPHPADRSPRRRPQGARGTVGPPGSVRRPPPPTARRIGRLARRSGSIGARHMICPRQ
jgi:hypothetical protein